MPELPEVETVKRGLKELLPGLEIAKLDFNWPKGFPNSPTNVKKFVVGSKVQDVRRRGKVLIIDLSSGYSLVTHLKMTGQLVFVGKAAKQVMGNRKWVMGNADDPLVPSSQSPAPALAERFGAGHPTKSLVGELPDKSTRVIIGFKGGATLFFNDQRKFGWMKLMPTSEVEAMEFIKKLGPEPLGLDFSSADFIARLLTRKNSNIKAVLLDQKVVAGVGNIYADESLFAAGIHPSSIVSAIPKSKQGQLYTNLKMILELSIKKGGTTDKNYVDALGQRGNFMEIVKVFRREKQPCLVCGCEIIKIRVAGRGTHVCTKCQKLYKGST
jgi:formamidopyrimidine-DNA glycosylase